MAIGLATAAFLAYAGRVVQRRRPPAQERLAVQAFAGWWYGASLVILNVNLRTLLALAGVRDMALYLTLQYLGNLPLAVAVGCLLYYVLYLVTGRRGLYVPVAILYAAYFVYLTWNAARAGDRELVVGEWQVQLVGQFAPSPAESLVFGLLLTVPVLLTIVAYMTLSPRLTDRSQRYRLWMVCGAFFLVFGTILVSYIVGWQTRPWFALAYELPALAASVIVAWAYHPPRWLRAWLKVQPVEPVAPTAPVAR